jgi:hypothetical protein
VKPSRIPCIDSRGSTWDRELLEGFKGRMSKITMYLLFICVCRSTWY